MNGDEITIPRGDRRYRIRGLAKNLSPEVMKVNVLVSRQHEFHVDTFDLQTDRQRAAFIKRAAEELGMQEDVIRKDVGQRASWLWNACKPSRSARRWNQRNPK